MAVEYEIRNEATGAIEQLVEGKREADKIVEGLNAARTRHDGELVRYSAVKVEPPPRAKRRRRG